MLHFPFSIVFIQIYSFAFSIPWKFQVGTGHKFIVIYFLFVGNLCAPEGFIDGFDYDCQQIIENEECWRDYPHTAINGYRGSHCSECGCEESGNINLTYLLYFYLT